MLRFSLPCNSLLRNFITFAQSLVEVRLGIGTWPGLRVCAVRTNHGSWIYTRESGADLLACFLWVLFPSRLNIFLFCPSLEFSPKVRIVLPKIHHFLRSLFVAIPALALTRQYLVLPFQQEHFTAQRAPTVQVLSSQFRLLSPLSETYDGRHQKHTTKLSRPVAIMPLPKARYAFSLGDRSLPLLV